tara:strand:+ start:177 stop:596 length:420 start_codon:yes stop_codon:yes gene_type:complete
MNLFNMGQKIYVDFKLFDDNRNTIPWSNYITNDNSKYKKVLVGHIIDYKNSKYKVLWYIDLKKTWVHNSFLTKLPKNINIIKGISYINSLKISNNVFTIKKITKRENRLSGTKINICENDILRINQQNTLKYQNYNKKI